MNQLKILTLNIYLLIHVKILLKIYNFNYNIINYLTL